MAAPLTASARIESLPDVLGECEAIRIVQRQIRQIAPTNCTVLIVGETGTGKGLLAHYVHEQSRRADQPIVYINCATPPESELEAALIGDHKQFADTIRNTDFKHLANLNGQTLLIDEISELSPEGQANLLETMEFIEKSSQGEAGDHSIDIRFIVTSQHDLKELVRSKQFNQRLYYHLNLFNIKLPPLRDRGLDKITIAAHLIDQASKKHGKGKLSLTPDAMQAIDNHRWPGNFREIRNTIERAVVMADHDIIGPELLILDNEPFDELPEAPTDIASPEPFTLPEAKPNTTDLSLEDYFQHFVLAHQDHMNETELAQKLGISRKCLWERRQRLGIPRRKS